MAARHVDVNERRLRPVYDALDCMNNKKAIQQADKILKKQKDLHCAKVLKSVALLRSGRRDECEKLINEVKIVETCDDATLQAMTICFREMDKCSEISVIYELALKKKPKNEELCTHLFMSYVRTSDFKKQQQVAMNLYKTFQKNPYYFWAVMSYVLQAKFCNYEHEKASMLLTLAEKMIQKLINENKIESEAEVSIYLIILEMQHKYESALEVLSGPLGELLSTVVNAEKKEAEYLVHLERWREANVCYKNLIAISPDDWSYYQGYIMSLIKLIEGNYSPQTEGNLSSTVPDYTLLMAMEFFQALKIKELERDKRNRGPFLAVLELQRKKHEKNMIAPSEEFSKDLIDTMVEYFSLFGEKSLCFEDLCLYINLIDRSQTHKFLEMCRAFLTSSCEEEHGENMKTMLKMITIEKFSRYLGEKDHFSPEEKIAHAKHCMSMHRNGLKYGETLLPTDFQHSDEFAILAADLLLDCTDNSGHPSSCLRVLILLESALKSSPSNFQFKLLVCRLYSLLGAVGPCITYVESMELKHILNDTIGLNVTRYAAPLGHFASANAIYDLAFKFYQSNRKDTSEYVIASYKYGSFEKIIEIMNFKEKLEKSFFYANVRIEQKFLEIVLQANSVTLVKESFSENQLIEGLFYSEKWIDKLHDNRDLDILLTWNRLHRMCTKESRRTSFKHELLWLKLRVITINALAIITNCLISKITSEAITIYCQNVEYDELVKLTHDASMRYGALLIQLQKLWTEASSCEVTAKQGLLYGPLPTRWKSYLDGSYDNLLMCLAGIVQKCHDIMEVLEQDDRLQELVAVVKKDFTSCAKILKDNATLCSNSLTIEDNGKRIFNGSIIESLVLFLEAVSVVLVFLVYFKIIISKVTFTSQNKKKRKVLLPGKTQLLQVYRSFVESFYVAVSTIHENLLDEQVLHLAEDLTAFDINELYKMTDSSLLTEIWEKMQASYKTSVQEISDALKLKVNFLKTLSI